MICEVCKIEVHYLFPFKNQSKCFKCMIREKEKILLATSKMPKRKCKNCNEYFALKKGGHTRRHYCSQECATIAGKRQQKEFWTRKLQKTYPSNKSQISF